MIWANLALGFGVATLCLLVALITGTFINQWKLKRKEYSNGGRFLDSLIRDYIKQFTPGQSKKSQFRLNRSTNQKSAQSKLNHRNIDSQQIQEFYNQIFQLFEKSENEKEKIEYKKILDFLKDFSHPQSGPHWRLWSQGFQNRWGFAPSKLAIMEGLVPSTKIPASNPDNLSSTFFNFLEQIVFYQTWAWEHLDNLLPTNATASLASGQGIPRHFQHAFLCCWILEIAGMPPAIFMQRPAVAIEQLKKMTIKKRTSLIIKMATIPNNISFSDHIKKKFSIWLNLHEAGQNQSQQNNHQSGHNKQKDTQNNLEEEYKLLGVNPNDNIHYIKKMYRKMALTYHPDQYVNKNHSEFERKAIEKKFVKIKIAYEKIVSQKMKTG